MTAAGDPIDTQFTFVVMGSATAASAATTRHTRLRRELGDAGLRPRTQPAPGPPPVSAQVTAAWAVAELAATAIEATHPLHATGSEFLVGRTVIAGPPWAS